MRAPAGFAGLSRDGWGVEVEGESPETSVGRLLRREYKLR